MAGPENQSLEQLVARRQVIENLIKNSKDDASENFSQLEKELKINTDSIRHVVKEKIDRNPNSSVPKSLENESIVVNAFTEFRQEAEAKKQASPPSLEKKPSLERMTSAARRTVAADITEKMEEIKNKFGDTSTLDPLTALRIETAMLLLQSTTHVYQKSMVDKIKLFVDQLISEDKDKAPSIHDIQQFLQIVHKDNKSYEPHFKEIQKAIMAYYDQENALSLQNEAQSQTKTSNQTTSKYLENLQKKWIVDKFMGSHRTPDERRHDLVRQKSVHNATLMLHGTEDTNIGTNIAQNVLAEVLVPTAKQTSLTRETAASVTPIVEHMEKQNPQLISAASLQKSNEKAPLEKVLSSERSKLKNQIAEKLKENPAAAGENYLPLVRQHLLLMRQEWIHHYSSGSNPKLFKNKCDLMQVALDELDKLSTMTPEKLPKQVDKVLDKLAQGLTNDALPKNEETGKIVRNKQDLDSEDTRKGIKEIDRLRKEAVQPAMALLQQKAMDNKKLKTPDMARQASSTSPVSETAKESAESLEVKIAEQNKIIRSQDAKPDDKKKAMTECSNLLAQILNGETLKDSPQREQKEKLYSDMQKRLSGARSHISSVPTSTASVASTPKEPEQTEEVRSSFRPGSSGG